MLLAVVLPVILSIIVGFVTGDISSKKEECTLHTWSQNLMSQQLVCLTCNKINILDTKFNNYMHE